VTIGGYSWRSELQLAVQLAASSFLFFSAVSRSSLLRLPLFLLLPPPPSCRLSLSSACCWLSVSRLALTFRTAERRIGSLNKMTRLFIGAFVRVKVGTAFLSGGRPRESLCERFARRGAGRGGGRRRRGIAGERVPRLIGRRKLGRAVYFLFEHFRRAIIAHPVTAADAGIRDVYEMSKRRRRGSKFRAVSAAQAGWLPVCVYLFLQSRRLLASNASHACVTLGRAHSFGYELREREREREDVAISILGRFDRPVRQARSSLKAKRDRGALCVPAR